ncbi:hypothetical protein SNL152K_8869 [Streptomyces sp. NL15-2K]|nr:hypothetical protein SNL152K_8869 [Streptomyces sp. NL15-2K]
MIAEALSKGRGLGAAELGGRLREEGARMLRVPPVRLRLPKNSSVLVGAGVRVVSSAGARAGALGTW